MIDKEDKVAHVAALLDAYTSGKVSAERVAREIAAAVLASLQEMGGGYQEDC